MNAPRVLVDAWVVDAIEARATTTAMQMLYNEKKPLGLSIAQIRLLKRFYEQSTGKQGHKIKASDVKLGRRLRA